MVINISKLINQLETELETAERCNLDGEILTDMQYCLSRNLSMEEDNGKTELTSDELNAVIMRTEKETMAACREATDEATAYIWELTSKL